jgi:putative esterase
MTRRLYLLLLALLCALTAPCGALAQSPAPRPLRFEISFPASARAEPVTGRVFVMITRNDKTEPRLQLNQVDGIPFFGHDVENLAPGAAAVIDDTDLGFPVEHLRDIPAGDYFVQAFVNIYSEFRRADGHVVWMHDDQWEGQRWETSPGNLYSRVQRMHLDGASGYRIQLAADQKIPPVVVPPDTDFVKRFKIQSPMLTKFWGRPIYLGATVLLPRDYAQETMAYPVLYRQGHFSLAPPLDFKDDKEIYQQWMRDDFPRMIVVTFQHPNPYYDDSYAVNSANVGPYGDAIIQELIPEIERRFRTIHEPYARILDGGSTGGWESLALELFHPEFFGGTWTYCPDPVSFEGYEGVDIYKDDNAFYKQHEWYRVPTANIRDTFGEAQLTVQQKLRFELVNGTKGRSGHQMDIWSAVFGPVGEDGFFAPLIDPLTGAIHHDVAAYWKEHYDLLYYMQRNWFTLGPKIVEKLRIYTGDMDTFQLDKGVVLMERWMKKTADPHYAGYFLYGDRKPHCWTGPGTTAERLKEMAEFILRHKPEDATTPWWRY